MNLNQAADTEIASAPEGRGTAADSGTPSADKAVKSGGDSPASPAELAGDSQKIPHSLPSNQGRDLPPKDAGAASGNTGGGTGSVPGQRAEASDERNPGDHSGLRSGVEGKSTLSRQPDLLPKEHYSLAQKIHHLFFTAGSFAFFGVFGAILAWIILPRIYRNTPGTPTEKSMACRERVSQSFRSLFRGMRRHGLFTLPELPEKGDLPADGRFVLIANHPSLVDMVILFACFPQVVIVAANYMFSNPILGPLLRRCEFIDGGDGGPFSGASVIAAGIERINRGVPVLIFPEGTRSPLSGFGAFRRGAFDMAKRAGVPIIPAYISTRPRTLMKGMPWYAIPAETVELRITLGEKIESPEEESTRALQKRVEADYRKHLSKMGLILASSEKPPALAAAPASGGVPKAAENREAAGAGRGQSPKQSP